MICKFLYQYIIIYIIVYTTYIVHIMCVCVRACVREMDIFFSKTIIMIKKSRA